MILAPYLGFDGNCRQAFEYYEKVLGGRIVAMLTNGESPIGDQVPPETRHRIMHARLVAGPVTLMGSDWPSDMFHGHAGAYYSLVLDSDADADRVYEALSRDGEIVMPIAETFWATRFAMFRDQFGVP